MTVRMLKPAPIVMAQITNFATPQQQQLGFIVPTPDARLSVRVSVVFNPSPGYVVPGFWDLWGMMVSGVTAVNYQLWLAAAVQDLGAVLAVTNLIGERSNGAQIPDRPGGLPPSFTQYGPTVLGYSQTIVADCDAIVGLFTLSVNTGGGISIPPIPGRWSLNTRYQAISPMCDDEWAEVAAHCTPNLQGSPLVIV